MCRCVTRFGTESGQVCRIYSFKSGDAQSAKLEQQGPETLWISGYRNTSNDLYVPAVNATAPGAVYTLLVYWWPCCPAVLLVRVCGITHSRPQQRSLQGSGRRGRLLQALATYVL